MSNAMHARDALLELLRFEPMTFPLTFLLCVAALAGTVGGVGMRLLGAVVAVLTGATSSGPRGW